MTMDALTNVLKQIGKEFSNDIDTDSRYIIEVDIGNQAEQMGYPSVSDRYRGVDAVIPVRSPRAGMKVRIDGRTFVNYAMYEFGVAVPGHVARDTHMPHRPYVPNHSLIRHFQ